MVDNKEFESYKTPYGEELTNFRKEQCNRCGRETEIHADIKLNNGEVHKTLVSVCVDCELRELEAKHLAEQLADPAVSYSVEAFLTDEEKLVKLLWHPKVRKTIARIVELDKENDESQVKKG